MLLTDFEILEMIEKKEIVITPFDRSRLGSNSYDVRLAKTFGMYDDEVIDAKRHNKITLFDIPEEGFVLYPDKFYLATTMEYTETHTTVPFIEGKSSVGRLGINIHATACKGDIGFCGYWTLELSTQIPVRVYPGMPIGQLLYFKTSGNCITPYSQKASAKYSNQPPVPVESMMWKNTF